HECAFGSSRLNQPPALCRPRLFIAAFAAATLLGLPAAGQDSLPFPAQPSGSTAGPTIEDSTYAPLAPAEHLPPDAPNILIIMLDDLGYALPSTFGGDIATPTLTRLANDGIAYNAFHNAAMC